MSKSSFTRHVSRNATPGGGNPPLNSNVITGRRAVACCERAGLKALQRAYDYIDKLIPVLESARDLPGDLNLSGLVGRESIGLSKDLNGLAPPELLPDTEVPLPEFFPRSSPGTSGILLVGAAGVLVIGAIYQLEALNGAINVLTETQAILLEIERTFTQRGLSECSQCVKEHLLRQEKHKNITIETLGFPNE